MINNAKKAVIHIAKAQTGMTDAEYRDLLGRAGVTTSKDLTEKSFDIVMGQFERLGYRTKAKTRRSGGRKTKNLPAGKQQLMGKLEAILLDLGLGWGYVDAIAASRFKVDRAQWLEKEDLFKLVQMMVIHQKRKRSQHA